MQKKFEVEIRGCFGEIQLIVAPNVVGPNATDPSKKVFCIKVLSRTESCTFNPKLSIGLISNDGH